MNKQPKYLKLDGYAADTPRWKQFVGTPGMRAGMLGAAFSLAVEFAAKGSQDIAPLAIAYLFVSSALTGMSQLFENDLLNRAFDEKAKSFPLFPRGRKLLIDTDPPRGAQTSADDMQRAKFLKEVCYVGLGVAAVAFGALTPVFLAKSGAETPYNYGMALGGVSLMASTFLATTFSCAQRLNRVVKGQYVIIEDLPDRVHETAPAIAPTTELEYVL